MRVAFPTSSSERAEELSILPGLFPSLPPLWLACASRKMVLWLAARGAQCCHLVLATGQTNAGRCRKVSAPHKGPALA